MRIMVFNSLKDENQAPSTLIRFQRKTEMFCYGYGYRPHYNAENDHRKRSHSKTPSFFRVLQRMTLLLNVTNLKYGKYDITSEKINNNKRLIDRAKY